MQYLLGQARPEDQSSFEERLVTESEFYDELLIAEDELIDQYLSGELSESERESFENHFMLTPERQGKVRFGRAFNKYVSVAKPLPNEDPLRENASEETRTVPKPPPKPWYSIFLPSENPILSYSLAAALVLIIGTVSWLALQKLRNRSAEEPGTVYAVMLTPGITRGGESEKKISIPTGTGTLELKLELRRDDYQTYRAMLFADDGSEVWRTDGLRSTSEAGTKFIAVKTPARLLAPGNYSLKVTGLGPDGKQEDLPSYRFLVLH
ncbi:MAG: hypothetical protein JWM21_4642 [Acidobacteria bacterium]|nr:hypothetical protein [Acidobacteriota bacterium]